MSDREYFQLAIHDYQNQKYEKAVDNFNKSLALKQHWQTYQGLAWALHHTQKYKLAINAFCKSLSLQEDWQSYQGLAYALHKTQQYKLAVDAFYKSLSLQEDWQSYQGLTLSLTKIGKIGEATRTLQRFYRHHPSLGHIEVDPLMGEREEVCTTRELIANITKSLSSKLFSFYPSFQSKKDDEGRQLEGWKHLLHIHIPKCAGTNFERPLTRLIDSISKGNKSLVECINLERKHYLWHGNSKEKLQYHSYLNEVFQEKVTDYLQGSFFADHGSGHGMYHQNLLKFGINAKKICLTRDPSQRLISHINHYRKKTNSKDELLETCKKELFNVMHKYICDHDTSDTNEKTLSAQTNHSPEFDSIDFIDISDNNLISQVKSSFLSATTLPNIVQHHRLNEGSSIAKNNSSLNQNDLEDIYHDLVSKGFLERDKQIDFEFLKKRTKERLEFPEIIYTSTSLHPITYIFPQIGNPKLMRTKDFLADPLGAINARSA